MRSRRARLARAGAALALLCALLGADDPGEDPSRFYPLEVGNRWTWKIHRDRTLAERGAPIERRFVHGLRVAEVVERRPSPRRQGRDVMVLRLSTSEWEAKGGPQSSRHEVQQLAWGPAGLHLFEVREVDDPTTGAVRTPRQPQLRLLDARLEAGHTWEAGTLEFGDVRVELQARSEGIEDLLLDGELHRGCLKVRYEGTVRGAADTPEGRAEWTWGRYEHDVWYRPGVGPVEEEIHIKGELVLPGARIATWDEVLRRRISAHVLR